MPAKYDKPEAKPATKKTSLQVCEPASASIIESRLVEFICMDWSPAHTPVAEVHKQSWISEELILDEDLLQSVPSYLSLCWFSLDPSCFHCHWLRSPVPSHLSLHWFSPVPSCLPCHWLSPLPNYLSLRWFSPIPSCLHCQWLRSPFKVITVSAASAQFKVIFLTAGST